MAKECATKEGGSQTDVEELIAKKPASSKAGKCVRACLAETIGMVCSFDMVLYRYLKKNFWVLFVLFWLKVKDNHVDMENVAIVAAMAFDGNPSKIQVAKDLANECIDVTDEDRCEAATKIMECGQNAAKNKGMKFESLE